MTYMAIEFHEPMDQSPRHQGPVHNVIATALEVAMLLPSYRGHAHIITGFFTQEEALAMSWTERGFPFVDDAPAVPHIIRVADTKDLAAGPFNSYGQAVNVGLPMVAHLGATLEIVPDPAETSADAQPERGQCEFWTGTVEDEGGDLHGSEIIWGDGMDAADALQRFKDMQSTLPEGYYPDGCTFYVHGPYFTNDAAKD